MEEQNKKNQQTILVTGGAGYIGSITTKTLLDANYSVVVLDNLEKGHEEAVDKRAILEVTDLADQTLVDKIFKKYHFDAVIDFAAYIAVGESMEEPKKYLDNNVNNFIKLIDIMVENDVKYLIKSSTAAVYGTPKSENDLPLKEDYIEKYKPTDSALLTGTWDNEKVNSNQFFSRVIDYYNSIIRNNSKLALDNDEMTKLKIQPSIYGLSKMLDEIIMKKYDESSGLKYVILRYFNAAGADPSGKIGQDNDNPTHIFANAIFQALGKRKKLIIFGNDYPTYDGTGVRDYIHVNDLAIGHVRALQYLLKTRISDVFNLGTGFGYSVMDVIKSVEKASGKKIDYKFGSRRSGDVSTLYSDPSRAKGLLSWEAEYSLDDMASTAWKWHSDNPMGYRSQNSRIKNP